MPHFADAASSRTDARAALDGALADLEGALDGRTPDLLVAFATHHYGGALEQLGPRLARATGAREVLGCTAESVIGGARELEGRAGLALWAACLPDTQLRAFAIRAHADEDGDPAFDALPPVGDPARSSVLLLGDPYSFPATAFLRGLDERFPGVPVMGGLASGGRGPGQSLLFTREGVLTEGAAGVVLEDGVTLHPVVSQGCRPVGRSWVVTECEGHHVRRLGGRPAIEVLMETWDSLEPGDQELLQAAPLLGLAVDPLREEFRRGDFLVRPILGLDQQGRSVAVAEPVRRGQTVRLLVRDAASAREDLAWTIATDGGGPAPDDAPGSVGALLFSCNGRGSRLFGEPDHDVLGVRNGLGSPIPAAGFFSAGEIGPVGNRNFVHGFTASVAVFRGRGET